MSSVYLSIGHGRNDVGVFDGGHIDPDSGISEWGLSRKVVQYATGFLTAMNVSIVSESDMEPGTNPDQRGSVEQANMAPRLCCVDVHFAPPDFSGGMIGAFISEAGMHLCEFLGNAFKANYLPVSGSSGEPEDLFLMMTRAPAALVFCDRVRAYSSDELLAMGKAIAEGVYGFVHSEFAPRLPSPPLREPTANDPAPESTSTDTQYDLPVDVPPAPDDSSETLSEEDKEDVGPAGIWRMTYGKNATESERAEVESPLSDILYTVYGYFLENEGPDVHFTIRRGV